MKVILDIDGVLANFNKPACEAVGASYPPSTWHWYEDIPDGFNRVNGICNRSFWADLEWMHDGHDIMRIVTHYFSPHDIYLCTTPMPNSDSASGKVDWVNRHLPAYESRLIITTAPKSLLASPDRLLIDDKTKSVNEFRAAGGKAILVPRPWNILSHIADESSKFIAADIGVLLI